MTDARAPEAIKLPKLPDLTPTRMTIALTPAVHSRLQAYADLYRETYGVAEPLVKLIPHMLASFLESDKAFVRGWRARPAASTDQQRST